MGVKEVPLSSQTYLPNMLASLNKLRLQGHLSDVTIRVDHAEKVQEFKAHQVILAASSGYFKTIVLSEHWVQDKIMLTNVHVSDFATFLEFVYTGKVQVKRKQLEDVLAMAEFLDCVDLAKACKEEVAKMPQKRKKSSVCSDDVALQEDEEEEENLRRSKRKKKRKKQDSDDSDYTPNPVKKPREVTHGKTLKLRLPRNAQFSAKKTNEITENTDTDMNEDKAMEQSNEEKTETTRQSDVDEDWFPKDDEPNDNEDDDDNDDDMNDAFFTELDEEEPAVEPRPLQQEEVKWTSKAPFECSKCQRTFHYEKSFLKHLSTYHGEKAEKPEDVFRCGTCQQTFVNRSNLRTHERHVHSEERLFLCAVCSKTFKRRKDVQRHQRQVHERDNRKHVCSVCGKSLSCKAALLLHERIHTGTKPYQCDVCCAKFIQKTALKMHQRTHTGERPFACNLCSARFTQKHMLSYHIRSHTGEKPFMCEDCGKSFSSREYLRHHSNIHTGIKPFKCKQCGKGFSQRNSLNQHSKTHTGVRPYKCTSCEKDFTQLSALQRHQRIHTGEKPYMCNTCNRTFTDTSTLRRHTKTHSTDAPWKSFMVILNGNIEDKKPPPSLRIKADKTAEKKTKKPSDSDEEVEPKITATPPSPSPPPATVTATDCSTVAIPSDWASHGAIAVVSHSTLAGITVIHTEIPAGTKLQPLVTSDGSGGASVLSLENSGIAVPFSLAANVATTASIPTVTVSNGALAIVTESQAVPAPSVLEVAASQTILAPASEAKSPERVEAIVVGDTTVEVVEVKSEDLDKTE